jgi:hypothetical protein
MRRLLASVVCPLLLGFSGCGKKTGASAPNPAKASVPALPPVVREIPAGTVPLWPRVAEAYKSGPEALEALSRTSDFGMTGRCMTKSQPGRRAASGGNNESFLHIEKISEIFSRRDRSLYRQLPLT